MDERRRSASGCAVAPVTAAIGAAIGWFVTGPPKGDPGFHATIGMFAGGLVGFALAGPRGSTLVVASSAVGTVLGGFLGGLLMQGEELGAVIGIIIGALVGLVVGLALGAAVLGAEPDE